MALLTTFSLGLTWLAQATNGEGELQRTAVYREEPHAPEPGLGGGPVSLVVKDRPLIQVWPTDTVASCPRRGEYYLFFFGSMWLGFRRFPTGPNRWNSSHEFCHMAPGIEQHSFRLRSNVVDLVASGLFFFTKTAF